MHISSLCLDSLSLSDMEWTRGPAIGRGSSATVYLATTVSSGEPFAVKTAELSSSTFLRKEQAFLSNLSCPYIVKCLGFDVRSENRKPMYNLYMEYVPGGTLWDAIQRHGGRMDEAMIRSYARQILQGLDYLHASGLAHCDIKSRNILLGEDGLKIADLGCAKVVERVAGNGAFSGTPAFMAPEVARGEKQGFEADVWAVGCTVIEMATGNHPWPEINDPVLALYRIGFSSDLPEFPSCLSEKAKDFLAQCLKKDPKERWTAQELLEHPFLQDSGSDSESPKERANTTTSPSCVLDQGFWDALEDSETPVNLTQKSSWLNSPAERIKTFTKKSFSSASEEPNWDLDWDQDWVTVRSNSIKEGTNFSDENDVMMADEPVSPAISATVSVMHGEEEELESPEFDEDFRVFSLANDFSPINTRRGGLEMTFEIVEEELVFETVKFERPNEHSSPLQTDFLFPAILLLLPLLLLFILSKSFLLWFQLIIILFLDFFFKK